MRELNFRLTIATAVLLFIISANAQNVPTTLAEMVGSDEVELQYVS